MRFSTKDKEQDLEPNQNCAQVYTGAFWYDACHLVNINGGYLEGQNDKYAKGTVWQGFKGYWYSLKTTQMTKI